MSAIFASAEVLMGKYIGHVVARGAKQIVASRENLKQRIFIVDPFFVRVVSLFNSRIKVRLQF